MPTPKYIGPFTMSEPELQDIETFALRNDLVGIATLVCELRTLRREHTRLLRLVETLEKDPSKRFAKEVDDITGGSNAATES
jgi:hypothetical protein